MCAEHSHDFLLASSRVAQEAVCKDWPVHTCARHARATPQHANRRKARGTGSADPPRRSRVLGGVPFRAARGSASGRRPAPAGADAHRWKMLKRAPLPPPSVGLRRPPPTAPELRHPPPTPADLRRPRQRHERAGRAMPLASEAWRDRTLPRRSGFPKCTPSVGRTPHPLGLVDPAVSESVHL